ncbi:MAG: helix-turn-helix domain-containing protein [Terracidiphilus sp.]
MGTYRGKDTITGKDRRGADSLIGLAELFKVLGTTAARPLEEAGTEQTGGGPAEARGNAEKARPGRPRGWRARPLPEETDRLRVELDEIALAFRLCKSRGQRPEGWMRAVRQAIGIPVVELARRMGVAKSQVFRLEESEQQGRVRLSNLRRAAEAMGCELVYALVPSEGKLASMAAAQRAEDELKREGEAALRRDARRLRARSSVDVVRRGETIRQEAERLGIAAEIYGK